MSTWKKIAVGATAVILLSAIVGFTVYQSHKNVVTVQTGKVQRQDLAAVVSASGEVKPKTYVNIGANAFGKIIKLYVKEGERVKRGEMLAQLENVQAGADMDAMQLPGPTRSPPMPRAILHKPISTAPTPMLSVPSSIGPALRGCTKTR
jgi:multidrug efflux pump subunit AcrA (membrane-fusion protein)